MRVLSLFDGMSCLQIALRELNIIPELYYASEIDKKAIEGTMINFPDTIQLGDIEKWRTWDIDFSTIDFIGAGSPCQGFSFAGKQLAFDDPRSKLFFVFMDILNHVKSLNPNVKYLLENVRMKAEHELVISRLLDINPLEINSALVSAQNRFRLYWTNIGTVEYGLFKSLGPGIPQPKDLGIVLRDILESEVDEKYYISEKALARILKTKYSKPKFDPNKTGCLSTTNNSGRLGIDSGTTLISDRGQGGEYIFSKSGKTGALSSRKGCSHDNHVILNKEGYLKLNQDKAASFTAGGHSDGNHSDMDLIREVIQINPSKEFGGQPRQQNRIYDTEGISPAMQKGNGGNTVPSIVVHNTMPRSSKNGNGGTGHLTRNDGKTYCLDTGNTNAVESQSRIRRLTPLEVCRLQTVPDSHFFKDGKQILSDTQIYRQCGNGWTIKVITHILSYLP